MDITQSQFWNAPNTAGVESFSYADLLAQITADLPPPPPGASVNVGLGAIARMTPDQTIANLLISPATFDSIDLDDLGFLDVGSGSPRDQRFIIPDVTPTIERVVFGGTWEWKQSLNGDVRGGDTRLNGNGPGGLFTAGAINFAATMSDPTFNNRQTINTGPVVVSVGDFFTLNLFQDSGAGLDVNQGRVWMWVIR